MIDRVLEIVSVEPGLRAAFWDAKKGERELSVSYVRVLCLALVEGEQDIKAIVAVPARPTEKMFAEDNFNFLGLFGPDEMPSMSLVDEMFKRWREENTTAPSE